MHETSRIKEHISTLRMFDEVIRQSIPAEKDVLSTRRSTAPVQAVISTHIEEAS